jgi:hypothetical protein
VSGFDAVGFARGRSDEDGFDGFACRGEQEFGRLCVEEDARLGVSAEFVAESVGEIAMREGDEFGEGWIELRKLLEQVWGALLEAGEEGGSVVGEIVDA